MSLLKVNTVETSLVQKSPGNDALEISETGIVSRSNIPAFWAYNGTDTSATNPIIFTTAGLNTGNCYNTANGRFTAPLSGLYCISFRVLPTQNQACQCRLYLNGAVIEGLTGYGQTSSGYAGHSVTAPVLLTAGDYLQVYVTNGTALLGPNYNTGFTGWFIG
jgi:hypothetical protein